MLRVLTWTQQRFAKLGIPSARLDAELLIGAALGLSRVQVYTNFDRPLVESELAALRALVRRRLAREPVAYILGEKEFYGRRFRVDPRVLVPRPETELLVEEALAARGALAAERAAILDVGTGSGAIAVTLALERPGDFVVATERSPGALEVARANAAALGAGVAFVRTDLVAGLAGPFHVVCANLPYVAAEELAEGVPELRHEPREALVAAENGLAAIRALVPAARELLPPSGTLLLEIGAAQAEPVTTLLAQADLSEVRVRKDYAGHPRVAIARR